MPRVGDVVDRHRVVLEVAHGGMAAVYAVQRASIGGFEKLLAMKVLLPHLGTDEHFVNMFLDEARIASRIQHPNVVQVLDVGMHERLPFLLMEYLSGQSLARVVRRAHELGRALPIDFCLEVLSMTALGLHAAHEAVGADGKPLGVIHRDVSPHNVFVGYDGQIKVVDFGIAAARGRLVGTRTGEVKGKLAYLAPEQLDRSQPVTRAVDVWAWGVVAWELLSEKRLFASKDEASTLWNVLNQRVPRLDRLRSDLPSSVCRLVHDALERNLSKRPRDAKQVAETLLAALPERCSDVGSVMRELFADERVIEKERIAAALRAEPPPPLKEPEASLAPEAVEETHVEATLGVRSRQRSRRWLALGVVAAAVALAFGVWRFRERPVEPAPVAAALPERVAIALQVDERARFVLVDGVRHDERPVRIELAKEARALLELIGANGELVKREVGVDDDGRSIRFPDPAPEPAPSATVVKQRTKAAARRPAPARSAPTSEGPLLGNPF